MVAIVGPTAAGKTRLAIELAARLGAEIVNADALQAYRRLDIGTAKPTAEERRAAPHHLIDLLEPDQAFSAGAFAAVARTAIDEIAARGRVAIVVGGSGLYHRALFAGLAATPRVPAVVRRRLKARLAREGAAALHRELSSRDPASAERIAAADGQRIVRALELVEAGAVAQARRLGSAGHRQPAGTPLAGWSAAAGQAVAAAVSFGVTLPRVELYGRIAGRVEAMFDAGWEEEVADLLRSGIAPSAAAFQAIGYRQIVAGLEGSLPVAEVRQRIERETRRYAKRQLTWFRGTPRVRWLDADRALARVDLLAREVRLASEAESA